MALGHCGPCPGLIRQHCVVAKLQEVKCISANAPLVGCLDCCTLLFLSFLFDHLVPTLLLFLVLSPSLRHESSRDSAAFRGAPRSPSGYDLLAAAVWSEGSAATGEQRRPHPFHHCSPPRTRTPPRAPHKVSTKAHLIMTVKDYFICVVIVKLFNSVSLVSAYFKKH